jgi:hypothetical protein
MANLASTYMKQGRWKDAEELEVEVMESRKTKLGADHHETLMSMGNLGVTYSMQGKEDKAYTTHSAFSPAPATTPLSTTLTSLIANIFSFNCAEKSLTYKAQRSVAQTQKVGEDQHITDPLQLSLHNT